MVLLCLLFCFGSVWDYFCYLLYFCGVLFVDWWLVDCCLFLLLRFSFVDCCDLFALVIVLPLFVCYVYEYFVVSYMFLLNVVCFFWCFVYFCCVTWLMVLVLVDLNLWLSSLCFMVNGIVNSVVMGWILFTWFCMICYVLGLRRWFGCDIVDLFSLVEVRCFVCFAYW